MFLCNIVYLDDDDDDDMRFYKRSHDFKNDR